MELTWHKDAKASTYYATHNGRRIATARKDAGGAWIGSLVGLGHNFGGRRLMDVKGLALVHAERIYGGGEWTLFPARDLKPGMILGRDSWKDGEREIVSVDVDIEAQTVSVELTSESARELGLTLDDTCAIDAMVRVKVVTEETSTEPVRVEDVTPGMKVMGKGGTVMEVTSGGELIREGWQAGAVRHSYRTLTESPCMSGSVTLPAGTMLRRIIETEETPAPAVEPTPETVRCDARRPGNERLGCIRMAGHSGAHRDPVAVGWSDAGGTASEGQSRDETEAPETTCGLRRLGWERPGPGARRLPCTLPTGHTQPHRDAFRRSFVRSEADATEDKVTAPVPTEVGQVIDLHPFTAIVDVIAGTGVLIAPPASNDLSVSAGGASLHDALLADVMRRLALLGVEALEGEDDGLSLEGVTDDGRKVFSLYLSDSITTEPDFEEVACSIEALRRAAGL
ncbi:hypothetical protein OG249_27060 [Streptomyces microflavus]|uniref:hypothetical protein n=1 Tax=Streptomyces microflavus TaxID=1919 RepID=UPI0022515343|nr:hypothetical protein [Streptomyces microflavus]MCX4655543.1 hypothetical protein [Streptomyces microflavus]